MSINSDFSELRTSHLVLLLAERAQSRDYSVKMWSSENQYLTASQAKDG